MTGSVTLDSGKAVLAFSPYKEAIDLVLTHPLPGQGWDLERE